jgi:uncharacterized protein YqiB (DUF1249 family)
VRTGVTTRLNRFLDQWLANALDQGHSFKEEAGAA